MRTASAGSGRTAVVEAIGIGVFVFVTLAVGGWRLIDRMERAKARLEAERLREIASRANRPEYRGPYINKWGREVE